MPLRRLTLTLAAGIAAGIALAAPIAAEAGPKHCPPGLAKKAVPCVPPGHAKRQKHSHDHAWRVGDRLPRDVRYVIIDDYDRYGLPRPDRGTQYVRIDNDIFRIALESARILESVRVIGEILD